MKKTFCTLIMLALATMWVVNHTTCLLAAEKTEQEKKKDSQGEKTYLLRYHFQPNETLCWEVARQGRNQTTVSGTTQTLETASKSKKIWKVIQVNDDGSAVFENQVEDIHMWQKKSGCEAVQYNSKKDKTPPHGFERVADRIGKPLSRITLDQYGDVQERVELVPKIAQDDPEGQITIPLPKKAIPVGHTWRIPHEVFVPLEGGRTKKVLVHQTFTLANVKNDVATIKVATQILTPIRDPALEVKLIDRYRRGTVRFDIKAGRILSQQMDLDKQVIGFSGPDSRIHYLTRFTERLQTSK